MIRIVFGYGLIAGVAIIVSSIFILVTTGGHHDYNLWLGYLIMLIGLSSVLVGVKQHRDQALGGVIRFRTALGLGLGIAVVASLAYVLVWEIYLAATHYRFMDQYTAHMLAAKRAAGVSGEAYRQAVASAEEMRRQYANPMIRTAMTFAEIFPVGLVVAIVSAALLRNPRFLPARGRPARA